MQITQRDTNLFANRKVKLPRGELAKLARAINMKERTLAKRLQRGWAIEEALASPVLSKEAAGYIGRFRQLMKERGLL